MGRGGKYMPSPFSFGKYGEAGIDMSELYPHLGKVADELCILRGMHTTTPNHEPGLLMMNSGNQQPIRPCLGSWVTYGLGTENQNLPGFVVLCPGKPVVGPALWGNSFLPGIYQGAFPICLAAVVEVEVLWPHESKPSGVRSWSLIG